MEVLAVRTARVIAHLNAEELNPAGRPIAHEYFNAFVERYQFIKRPTTADEILDAESKGISFELGKLDDIGIQKVVLFDWGVVVETSKSTDASEKVFQDILEWGAEKFGMSNRPSLIMKRNYVSELVFTSDLSLPALSAQLQALSDSITTLVSGYLGESLPFETVGVTLAFDSTQTKQLFTPFSVQRMIETPFSLHKYYSGAPLKTLDHINVLYDLEVALMPPGGALPFPGSLPS
jgi:hypothetical protein